MKLFLVQKDVNNLDLSPFLKMAKEADADLVGFGELATSGCLYQKCELPKIDSFLSEVDELGLRVTFGTPLETPEGTRNAYVYRYKGEQQAYFKVNLFPPMNEPDVYVAGNRPGQFETDLGKLGAAICYDIRFPELFDQIAATKPKLVMIPAAFPRVRINDWRGLLVERAIQMSCPVVGINAVGDDGTNEFGGTSAVVSAEGQILAQADETSETTLEVEIDL